MRTTKLATGIAIAIAMAGMLVGRPAQAALSEYFAATGELALSVDASGSNDASHVIEVEKPNNMATVRQAFLLTATTPGGQIADGSVALNGTPISWQSNIPGPINNRNAIADVTSLVKPIMDAAAAGRTGFTLTEAATTSTDGEILAVVFDDPQQTNVSTVILLFGSQAVGGDDFAITLAEPIDPMAAGARLDMGLGISFSYQGNSQVSIIDVNGTRLTSSAGGQDDGVAANGALITVGGLDDTNANPVNPLAAPSGPRDDDELYSLLPFITASSTNVLVHSANPSNDDGILFAYFQLSTAAILGEGILLAPTSATNPVGTTHTVTATVADDHGDPVVGRTVTFSVVSGPNAGDGGAVDTDVDGKASFTYTGDGGAGTDVIRASFVDSHMETQVSNDVTKDWVYVCGNGVREGTEECDDGNTESGDCCSPTCQIDPDATPCSDGTACTEVDTCVDGACVGSSPVSCDDGNGCTFDTCEPSSGACVHDATPRTGCRSALRSLLLIKNKPDDAKDKLIWKWQKGTTTTLPDFGAPSATTDYTLCIYAGTASATLDIPAGSGWKPLGTKGFSFKGPGTASDGVQKVQLKSGGAGKSKVQVKGKGIALPDLAAPLAQPITVQLVNDETAACFEAAYDGTAVTKNTDTLFKAKR